MWNSYIKNQTKVRQYIKFDNLKKCLVRKFVNQIYWKESFTTYIVILKINE